MLVSETISKISNFIVETEKLKDVNRRTKVIGLNRYENSAEHSWSVSLVALLLKDFFPATLNIDRIIKMLIVHDIVEIDAGDKFIYSEAHCDTENEEKAAERIFGILPHPLKSELKELWEEYETRKTLESKYAYLIDRITPLICNLNNNGQSWVENSISYEQVIAKNGFVSDLSPELWKWLLIKIDQAKIDGWLK